MNYTAQPLKLWITHLALVDEELLKQLNVGDPSNINRILIYTWLVLMITQGGIFQDSLIKG